MLTDKCLEKGIELRLVDRWYPSSKLCSTCRVKKTTLSLSERIFACDNCDTILNIREAFLHVISDMLGSVGAIIAALLIINKPYEDSIVYMDISLIRNGGNRMANFQAFDGVVTMIDDFSIGQNNEVGCYKLFSVDDGHGATVNFVVAPTTYFVDHVMVVVGDRVTGFYDANAPVPLIYPPQFRALVMARDTAYQNVKVAHFNRQLESSDGILRLNIAPHTRILLENGQAFTGSIGNRNLIVVYGATTRSIPAQTTPTTIIVMC